MTPSVRRLRAAAILALAFAAAGAVQADTAPLGADLDGLLDYARTHNPGFAVERLEALAAHERVGPAGALPDPTFQIELMDATNTMRGGPTTLIPGEVGETRYRISQPLPGWGKRELDSRAAAAQAARSDAARDAAWLELATEIKEAWLRHYAASREAALNREALALLEGLEATTLARYRLGLVEQQAVLRAQREITAQRLALVAVEQRRASTSAALNALLARAPDAPLAEPAELPAPDDVLALAELVERARMRNPGLAAEAHGIDAARLERDRTFRDRYPDFGVGLTYNRPRSGRESWDVMFEVMIPLQQSARRGREREAERMVEAADARRAAAEARLLGDLGRAHAQYRAGRETLRLLRGVLLPQAEATRDATRAAFETARVDFDSVLEAERELIDTWFTLLEADVETRLALFEIEKLVGETL